MRQSTLLSLLLTVAFSLPSVHAQTCPNAPFPGCGANAQCSGECVDASVPPIANGCQAANDCTNGFCVTNLCLTVSFDATSCGGNCPANQFCVNGVCLQHGANGARCPACTTAGAQICYTGCLISSQRNIASGPCANVPGATGGVAVNTCGTLPAGATVGKTCSVVCRSPTTTTSTTTVAPNTRPRCEDTNGNLLPNADSCSDEAASTECANTFRTPGAKRPAECDNQLIDDAVKRCAKTCKVCCELPQYNCQDQPQPSNGPTCAENKRRGYCDSFRPLMQTACPATCGLCQSAGTGNCADKTSGCYSLRTYCPDIRYHQYMKENCAKTCKDYYPNVPGFCEATGGANGSGGGVDKATNCQLNAGLCNHSIYYKIMTDNCCATCNRCSSGIITNSVASSNPNCADQNSACVNWNARGFCTNTFYPQSTKQRYCSRTCGFCR